MNDVELKCFLYAAECLNFSEAAERLFISKSAFSRSIARLEAELDVVLFVRDTKNTVLTPAGEYFFSKLKVIDEDLTRSIQKTKDLHNGISGVIRLGLLEGQAMELNFHKALRDFRQYYPDVKIDLVRDGYFELTSALKEHTIDGVVTLDWEINSDEEINYLEIVQLDTMLVVPALHPLTDKKDVSINDFQGETFITPKNHFGPEESNTLKEMFAQYKFQPSILETENMQEHLLWLEAGRGIAFCNAHNILCQSPSVTTLHLPELQPSTFVFAWNAQNVNPTLGNFIQCIEEYL